MVGAGATLGSLDVLSKILESVRLRGTIVSRGKLGAPWALETKGVSGAAIFHAMTRGGCWLLHGRDEPLWIAEGEVVLLPRGDRHALCDAPSTRPIPRSSLTGTRPDGCVELIEHGGSGARTEMICGVFRMDHSGGDALLRLLPEVCHVTRQHAGVVDWFDATIELLARELEGGHPGADTLVARLADVLFVQIMRAYAARLPDSSRGWLAALRDPQIGKALAAIHGEPATPWTVVTLASRVGMSRSSFFSRFTGLMGEPPAQYLARWRVFAATDLLQREEALSMAELAQRVGYASENALSKVFKRYVEMTPREYRRRRGIVAGAARR